MKRDFTRSTTKSDYSRATFRPEKHYSSVRMQQGRVQLDADWNEQIDITAYRTEIETIDVIGGCGGPLDAAGFGLTDGPAPQITPGRYYVDGILIENEAAPPISLGQQSDLPGVPLPAPPATGDALYIVYLDVWQRQISALEDTLLSEVALNGPDTATRTKSLWQVKLLGPLTGPLNCTSEPPAWQALLAEKTGRLSARAPEGQTDPDPCAVPPGAGYRRLENQLYRVEIHGAGIQGTATFKWSRENGSIVTSWLDKKDDDLIVASVGKDKVLGFAAGQTIEVIDDQRELRGEVGILAELARAEGQALTLAPGSPLINKADFPDTLAGQPNHPKVRRWDSDGVITIPTDTSAWLELEDGVEIKFEPGTYNVGDYWLVPARTVSGDVEWPFTTPQPPAGVSHHYCKLAIATLNATGFTFSDCRNLFPPLTKLVTILYESGDGQEAMPGQALPQPCRVRVVNGQAPRIGAPVRFMVESGGGSLSATVTATVGPDGIAETTWTLGQAGAQRIRAELLDAANVPIPGQLLHFNAKVNLSSLLYESGDGQEGSANNALPHALHARVVNERTPVIGAPVRFTVESGGGSLSAPNVTTVGTDGIAQTTWILGPSGAQRVRAELLDAANVPIPGQLLHYNAAIRTADGHGCCCVTVGAGGEFERLDEALFTLLEQGENDKGKRDICICLMPGDHLIPGFDVVRPFDDLPLFQIQIKGCGLGSRILPEGPITFTRFRAFTLHNLAIEFPPLDDQDGLALLECSHVTVTSCHLTGTAHNSSLLRIADANQTRLGDTTFEAARIESLLPVADLFAEIGHGPLAELFKLFSARDFQTKAKDMATELTTLSIDERVDLSQQIESRVKNLFLSSVEEHHIYRFTQALRKKFNENDDEARLLVISMLENSLLELRLAAIKARPGVAVVLARTLFDPPLIEEAISLPRVNEWIALHRNAFALLENNVIVGEVGLYDMPASLDFIDGEDGPLNSEVRGTLESALRGIYKESKNLLRGSLGTLQLRGNQLVRIAIDEGTLTTLREQVETNFDPLNLWAGLYNSLHFTDNVIEGMRNVIMGERTTFTANEFSATASTDTIVGYVIMATSIYMGNRGDNPEHQLFDISGRPPQLVANVDIAIV